MNHPFAHERKLSNISAMRYPGNHFHPRTAGCAFLRAVLLFTLAATPLAAQPLSTSALLDSAARILTRDPARAANLAMQAHERALTPEEQIEAQHTVGVAWQHAGYNARAAEAFRAVLNEAGVARHPHSRALALLGLGVASRNMGYHSRALDCLLHALALEDSLGDERGSAAALHETATTFWAMGRLDDAWHFYRRAIDLRYRLDDRKGIAETLRGLGEMHWRDAHRDSARVLLEQALELERGIAPFGEGVVSNLNLLGMLELEAGNRDHARALVEEATRIADAAGNPSVRSQTLLTAARLQRALRQNERAEQLLIEAATFARSAQRNDVLVDILADLVDVAETRGDPRAALRYQREWIGLRDSLNARMHSDRVEDFEARYMEERISHDLRELDEARQSDALRFLIVSLIFLAVAFVVGGLVYRNSRKRNIELMERNAGMEANNAKLRSLHEQMSRSEEQYRLLFEGLPVGVFYYDAGLRILRANSAFAEILALPMERCQGMDLRTLKDWHVLDALGKPLRGHYGMYEGPFLSPSTEQEILVSLRTAPMRGEQVEELAGMGFLLDISDWKQVERELLGAKEAAEQAVRLKQAFLTSISHEIRTPLNVIMGYLGVLQSDIVSRISAGEREYFVKVDLAVRRLIRTVDQLLSLSILESGGYAMETEVFSLSILLEQLVDETRPLAEDKNLRLHYTSAPREVFVRADKYSVAQALRNVLDNAVKFTDRGEIGVTVSLRDTDVAIAVSDTGIGISEAYLRQLYDAFTQENVGYTRPYDGLGLGLTLTKRYLDANNGGITVKSTKGLGTTFTIAFLQAGDEIPREPEIPADHWTPDPSNTTVLIVEDDHETQKFLHLVLSPSYSILLADSAADAWDLLMAHKVDLVLMDISLRGDEDGLSLTRRIRQHAPIARVPVIAVTAHAFSDDRRRSFEAGCDDYLAKPFRTQQLHERIDRQLFARAPGSA